MKSWQHINSLLMCTSVDVLLPVQILHLGI